MPICSVRVRRSVGFQSEKGRLDMPIPFRCSSCGQEYPLADDLDGQQVRCAFCGEFTRAVAPASAAVAPAPRRAGALHALDLTALSDAQPPSASAPAAPKYAMDYIAPPPKPANRVAPTAPRAADPFPDPDPIPDLAPLAPAPAPAPAPT